MASKAAKGRRRRQFLKAMAAMPVALAAAHRAAAAMQIEDGSVGL